MQQWPLRYAVEAELACLPAQRALEFAHRGAALAALAALAAWALRRRAAAAQQQGMWALASMLAGAMHVILAMFWVPTGCLSGALFGRLLGAAAPWVLAAGLLRTGVAPPPAPLTPPNEKP
ncbi:MAG: hypothetical protein R3A48_04335 [Polyangiales bacterium]